MSSAYLILEVKVEDFVLPEPNKLEEIEITTLSGTPEHNELISIFTEIFPNEINQEKEGELRTHKNPRWEGTYIAKMNGKLVGFLITGILVFPAPSAYILYLGVIKEYRSKGVARHLLNTFKNDLLKKKIPVIQARIKKDNYVVLNYIKSLGFKLIN